jgi:hypothetical protein
MDQGSLNSEHGHVSKDEKIYTITRKGLSKQSQAVIGAIIAFAATVAFTYGILSFNRPDLVNEARANLGGTLAILFGVGVAAVTFTAQIAMLGTATFEKVNTPEARVKFASSVSNLLALVLRLTTGIEFTEAEEGKKKQEGTKDKSRENTYSYEAASTETSFEVYVSNILRSLSAYAASSEVTATKLLDKGVAFMAGGLVFYVLAIVIWQVFANLTKPDAHVMYVGMIACSMTFVIVEFLAAWFFKQYRYYVEVSLSCLRVRSVYDRYLLGYYALREFEGEEGIDARDRMMEVLKEDVNWPTYKGSASNDFNYMIESMSTAHTSIEKFKNIFQQKKDES